jgi:hypothetical protein
MRNFLVSTLLALSAQAATLSPGDIALKGPEANQQLLFTSKQGGTDLDLTRKATWTSSNPEIAKVDGAGLVRPVADGEAVITAVAGAEKASVTVRVSGSREPFSWSFRNHVIPVLTKAGCNQGACHGALAGKNGFKLTLRGYDPELDFDVLTRQSIGRRVNLADPTSSILLQKPVFELPHGGGKRLNKDSLEYRIIAEWVAAGTPAPSANDPEVKSLEVYPAKTTLTPGSEHQLVVRARYTDGSMHDVTRWVKYSSSNEGVATVDDNGLVKVTGHGQAAITLWYNSRVLYSTIVSPYQHTVNEKSYANFVKKNYIDELVVEKLRELRIEPSKPADDATFLRRMYLDAAGILPTAEEVEEFLADKSPDKRARAIDRLLERDEFADYWAYRWSDLLLVSSRKLQTPAMWAFYKWIRESVKQNKPWDQFAREIFTGQGSTRQNGALNYFVIHKDVIDITETTTQAFLGQRLTCARCHNHPLEKWTQKQYYQLANLFARVGVKNGSSPGDNVIFAKVSGDINHPRLLRPLNPTPLDGQSIDLNDTRDRRAAFAEWLTNPKNELFTRNIVNRVFGTIMGRGLVDPIDDVRATNPASNEALFQALSKDFVAHKYDIKHLIRTILNSSTYQLSSESNATNQDDRIFYSKYVIRRLPAEALLDSISQVLGVPTTFGGYPVGTRALQLPDVRVENQFLSVFGRPIRNICDAGERNSDPTITQALHVINGDTVNKKLSDPNGYVSLMLKLGLSDSRIIDHVMISALGRYPNENERREMTAKLAEARSVKGSPEFQREARQQALEDLVWALLTSKEFLFNH